MYIKKTTYTYSVVTSCDKNLSEFNLSIYFLSYQKADERHSSLKYIHLQYNRSNPSTLANSVDNLF